jgi:8-oxo-dGTP pyrophosphatase MutT (NUDIX family)
MRRPDYLAMILVVGLGMGSLALIVAGFNVEGNTANLLIALGVTVWVASLFYVVQQLNTVATRPADPTANTSTTLPSREANLGDGPREADVTLGELLADAGPASSPSILSGVRTHIRIYRAASAAPQATELIARARKEVLAMVVSGRNFFQPQLHDVILKKMHDAADETVFRILALNHFSGDEFLDARTNMMDMRRGPEFRPVYEKDFETVREYSAQVTMEDPTRERFDIRFYDLMPTVYFYIVDGVLFLGSLLSKPVASSPMIVIEPTDEDNQAVVSAYRSHFDHYWSSSRFFVVLIGLTSDGRTLLVRNRRRGLEWPVGYIEPNEHLETAAAREFREETGYAVGEPRQLVASAMGYYFVARIGDKVTKSSAREVSDTILVSELPDRKDMSFTRDYYRFVEYFERAKQMIHLLPPPRS